MLGYSLQKGLVFHSPHTAYTAKIGIIKGFVYLLVIHKNAYVFPRRKPTVKKARFVSLLTQLDGQRRFIRFLGGGAIGG